MWGQIAAAAIPAAIDLGAQWLSNKMISEPNSALSFEQSKALQEQQYVFNQRMASTAYQRSKASAETAFEREKTAYKRRYKWTVEDMKRAGLNPILAASGGFNVGSGVNAQMAQSFAPGVSMTTGTKPDYPQAGSSALNLSRAKKESASAENILAEMELNIARKSEAIANTALKRQQAGTLAAEEKATIQRVDNLKQEIILNGARIMETYENIEVLNSRKYLNETEIQNMNKMRKNIEVENKRLNQNVILITEQLKKLKKIADVYEGPAGGLISYIHEILGALSPAAGPLTGVIVGKKFRGRSRGR